MEHSYAPPRVRRPSAPASLDADFGFGALGLETESSTWEHASRLQWAASELCGPSLSATEYSHLQQHDAGPAIFARSSEQGLLECRRGSSEEAFRRTSEDGWSPDSVLQGLDDCEAQPAEPLSRKSSILGYEPADAAMLPPPLLTAHDLVGWTAEEGESDSYSAMEVEAAIDATLMPPGSGRPSVVSPPLQPLRSASQQHSAPQPPAHQHSAFHQHQRQQQQQQRQRTCMASPQPGALPPRQPWQQELAAQRQQAAQRQAFERQLSSGSAQSLSRLSIGSSAHQPPPPPLFPDSDFAPSEETFRRPSGETFRRPSEEAPRRRSLLQVHQGGSGGTAVLPASTHNPAAAAGAAAAPAASTPFALPALQPEPLDEPWWIDDAAPQVERSVRAASMSAASAHAHRYGSAAAAFGLRGPQQPQLQLGEGASTRRPSLPPLPPRHVRRASCSATALTPLRTHSGPSFGRPEAAAASFADGHQHQRPRSPPEWQRRPTWASEWAAQHVMRSAAAQQDVGSCDVGGGGGARGSGSSPMHSIAYLQAQERRYISAGV